MRFRFTRSMAVGLITFALGAQLCRGQASPERLVGIWVFRDMFQTVEIWFLADGRYSATIKIGDAAVPENGRYEVRGAKLKLAPQGAEPVTYDYSLSGNRLTLSGGNYGAPQTFEKVPGSEVKVAGEARRADAGKAREDAEWRARIKVAPIGRRPAHVPVGEVPADPNGDHVFKAPTIFSQESLYLRLTPYKLQSRDGTASDVFNSWKWYFLPTGRVFVRTEQFRPGGRYDPARPRGEVKTFWGAYRIEPGAEVDKVYVETDQGEKVEMEIRDGRRNLYWGNDVYGHVEWEREALRRQAGKP